MEVADGGVSLKVRYMMQEERWLVQWKAVMYFMAANKRRPSKFMDSEKGLRNRWKHQQKLVNAGEVPNAYGIWGSIRGLIRILKIESC
jgi:hypothetical protein